MRVARAWRPCRGDRPELERVGPARPLPDVPSPEEHRRHAEAEADRQSTLAALVRERRSYEIRGLDERIALVDVEIARISADGKAPAPASRKASSRRGSSRPPLTTLGMRRLLVSRGDNPHTENGPARALGIRLGVVRLGNRSRG
jgi:uncharacterized small protein (DUF1192 family)